MKNHILCHTGERSPLSSRICKRCKQQITPYRTPTNQMLRHTGERSFSGPRFVNPVTKNSCPIESLRSTLSSTLEKKHFQDPDLWIIWQKVQVKCNLKEAHSFPYWREANFRTRICESCDKKFMSSAILKNHIVFHTGEKPFSGPGFVNHVTKSSCQVQS